MRGARLFVGYWGILSMFLLPALVHAQEEVPLYKQVSDLALQVDWFWTIVAACLVFFMQAGFSFVEGGFTRAKNIVNIMMKNIADLSIGAIGFGAIGFGLMFSGGVYEFFLNPDVNSYGEDPNWMYAFLIFQTVFAATAATIVSGAIAERTKFSAYLIFSLVITTVIYPVSGSWAWGSSWHGSGWLEDLNFVDFAGSTVVHGVGGWAALAGAIILGPRRGKYNANGTVNPLVGHNMSMAALGVFILWLGWFGFNAGSTRSMDGGALAGLVGITAGCYTMTPAGALMTGAVAGILVVFSVLFFEKVRVDDPVGAISVHGVCGVWGTFVCAIPFSVGQESRQV